MKQNKGVFVIQCDILFGDFRDSRENVIYLYLAIPESSFGIFQFQRCAVFGYYVALARKGAKSGPTWNDQLGSR